MKVICTCGLILNTSIHRSEHINIKLTLNVDLQAVHRDKRILL